MNLKTIIKKILRKENRGDYREYLFHELKEYLDGDSLKRILEIGPKDGKDTLRLLTLNPETLVLIDLPSMEETNSKWLKEINSDRIKYISANFMYSPEVERLEPFDCIWCTGVLYHNPEQLRMIRKLYDLLKQKGILVIESATIRQKKLRNQKCVEIIYPPSVEYKRKYHISLNVTHLPSSSAIEAWLKMVGFEEVRRSNCHKKQSPAMAKNRAAFICRKGNMDSGGKYYAVAKEETYLIGRSL